MLCVLVGINFSGSGGCGLSLSLQPQSGAAKISGQLAFRKEDNSSLIGEKKKNKERGRRKRERQRGEAQRSKQQNMFTELQTSTNTHVTYNRLKK